MEKRIDKCLIQVLEWAEDKVAAGREPPWAWYQYMKLIETVNAIRYGRLAVKRGPADLLRTESSARSIRPRAAGGVELEKPRRRGR
jgi:hypothetical protein